MELQSLQAKKDEQKMGPTEALSIGKYKFNRIANCACQNIIFKRLTAILGVDLLSNDQIVEKFRNIEKNYNWQDKHT